MARDRAVTGGDLVLVGAGGLGRETAEVVRACNDAGAGWRLLGFLDDDPRLRGTEVDGVPVLGGVDEIANLRSASVVVCTARPGDSTSRRRITGRLDLPPSRYPALVHPSAAVSASSSVGPGSVLLASVVLTAAVRVGAHVALMPHVTLTHDDVLEDFVTVASGVRLGGGVRVCRGAYLGAGALVREGATVGAGALVGMGAVVTRDVPEREVWVGVPARRIRTTDTSRADISPAESGTDTSEETPMNGRPNAADAPTGP